MTISIRERRAEVGLLRALGSSRRQILWLFLGEAVLLGLAGGFAGLVMGTGGAWLLGTLVPGLPVYIAWEYTLLALLTALSIGLLAGVLPALRAADLNPVEALHNE
jgi:putative ABC transport system permease protein